MVQKYSFLVIAENFKSIYFCIFIFPNAKIHLHNSPEYIQFSFEIALAAE